MIDKLKNLFAPKASKERKAKLELAKKLDGKSLRCVSERINGIEEIVARDGAILVKDGKLIVYGGSDIVFRGDILSLNAGELLSLEGVVIDGTDEISGISRSIVAYYKYWRELR